MKKRSLAAVALATLLCALPVAAACDTGSATATEFKIDGKAFNVANYARSVEDAPSLNPRKVLSSYQVENFGLAISINDRLALAYLDDAEHPYGYKLYDVEAGTILRNSMWYTTQAYTVGGYNSPFFALGYDADEGYYTTTKYEYFCPTGELVTSDPVYGNYYYDVYVNYYSFYEGDERTTTYAFNYYVDESGYMGELKTLYFAYTYRYEDATYTWKAISEAQYENYYENREDDDEDGYHVGDTLGVTKYSIADEEEYPDYIYKDYKYSTAGDTTTEYTFYNGDVATGSVTFNGYELGFLGKYFYYTDATLVPSDSTSGYNFESGSYSSTVKGNLTLYRYNFVSGGKAETVKTSYLPGGNFRTFYNNQTNDFDMAYVQAYQFVNGVAVMSQSFSNAYSLLVDSDLKISADVSAKSLSYDFYKLSDNRFLSGRTIVDGGLNTVAQFSGSYYVWQEENLIQVYTNYGYTFIDFDGKVVLPSMQNIQGIYGSTVFATKDGQDAVYSKANPNGKTVRELISAKDEDSVSIYTEYGIILKGTNIELDTLWGTTTGYTYAIYNLEGNRLGTVSNTTNMTVRSYGNKIIVAFSVYENYEESYKTVILG